MRALVTGASRGIGAGEPLRLKSLQMLDGIYRSAQTNASVGVGDD
jgi:hypothetical protein